MATRSAKSAKMAGRVKKSLYRPENEAVWASFRQLRKAAKLSQAESGQRLGPMFRPPKPGGASGWMRSRFESGARRPGPICGSGWRS